MGVTREHKENDLVLGMRERKEENERCDGSWWTTLGEVAEESSARGHVGTGAKGGQGTRHEETEGKFK